MTRFEITEQDLVSAVRGATSEQTVLQVLKDKGAPVSGTFWLTPDLFTFKWLSWHNPETGTIVFEVRQ